MKSLICLLSFLLLYGCSQQSSILSEKVQKDRGHLKILNTSGFIGATVAGTDFEYTLILQSNGGLSVSDISASLVTSDPISYKGGSYPGTGGTCGSKLSPGETCTIIIHYAPEDTRSHVATLNFSYRDALSARSLSFVLSADSHPILSFKLGTVYDFSNKFVGSSNDLTIAIENVGKVSADTISVNNLSAPYSFKGGSYPGTGGNCGTHLTPGQSCELVVNYSPAANGEHLQDITLNYLNTGRPEENTLHLKAWGFHRAVVTVSDSPGYHFGTVPSNYQNTKVFTLTHSSGDVPATGLNVTGISSPFSRTGGSCGTSLAKNASCTVSVSLNAATSGSWSNNINFNYIDGNSMQAVQRSVTGVTKERAVISVTPTGSVDLGVVARGGTGTRTFTVTYVSGELPATSIVFQNLSTPFTQTSSTCPTSFTSGTCTITLSYSPTTYETRSQSITFSYFNGASTINGPPINLTAKTEGVLSRYSMPFGNVVTGQTSTRLFTLSYEGGAPATGLTVQSLTGPFSFSGGSFPGGGNCNSTSVSTNCSIYLTYSPTVEGTHTGTLSLRYNDGLAVKTLAIPLSGTGTPVAQLSMNAISFGPTSVNSTIEQTVIVTNSSSMQASSILPQPFPSGFGFKGGSYPGTGGTCNASKTLAGNSTCTLVLIFRPSTATNYSGNFSLNYFDGETTKTASAPISGTAFTTSNLFLSDFDTVEFAERFISQAGVDKTFTLSHGGNSTPATIISKTLSTSDFTIISDNCPSTLVSGASCTIGVRFAPLSSGTRNSSLSISYSDGAAKSTTRLLKGSGKAPATLTITPNVYDWGAQPTDSFYETLFTVVKTGDIDAINVSLITAGSGFTFRSGSNTCLSTVTSSCSFIGRFTPTAVASYTGSLGIRYYNGFQYEDAYANLSGSGKPTATLRFSSSFIDFESIIQTQSVTKAITLTHTGPVPATAISTLALSAPFSYVGGSYPGSGGTCTDTLDQSSCTIVVEFSPITTGTHTRTLTLDYNNGTLTRQVSTTIRGKSLAQAIIGISESNPFNMGTVKVGVEIDKTFTIYNGGEVSGTTLSGSFDHTAFSFKGGSFPGTGGTCTQTLAGGGNCTIVLRFLPPAATHYEGTFTLSYHDGLRVQNEWKNLRGSGSNTLQKETYLSQIALKEMYDDPWSEIEVDGVSDVLAYEEGFFKYKARKTNQILFIYQNHNGPKFITKGMAYLLKGNKLLLPIYKKDGNFLKLNGYEIRSLKDGNMIEKYLRK